MDLRKCVHHFALRTALTRDAFGVLTLQMRYEVTVHRSSTDSDRLIEENPKGETFT